MDLDNFTLLCHSFGGYIGGWYALRFPEHVSRIIFMSPLGVDRIPEDIEQSIDNLHK